MKNIFFLSFPLIISFIECMNLNLKTSDMCFPIEGKKFECHGFYHYNCGEYVCTRSQYSCHILSLFSVLKGPHQKRYESLISKIKECSQYTWNPNDVCLNKKVCKENHYHISSIHRFWTIQSKQIECKCDGKYSYKCKNSYCAANKQVCDNFQNSTIYDIKNCD
jgi:hypothetical protein